MYYHYCYSLSVLLGVQANRLDPYCFCSDLSYNYYTSYRESGTTAQTVNGETRQLHDYIQVREDYADNKIQTCRSLGGAIPRKFFPEGGAINEEIVYLLKTRLGI